MLDLRRIREEPDAVRAALTRRDPALADAVEQILAADRQWRIATQTAEGLRATQKAESETIAAGKRKGEDVGEALAKMKQLSAEVKELVEQAGGAKQRLDELIARLPNLPDPTAAAGPEDELVRTVGDPPAFEFPALDHLDLAGPRIDMERAATLSGTRFAYLLGELVLVELGARALGPREAPRPRLRARDPTGARARARALWHRVPARHRAADLRAARR